MKSKIAHITIAFLLLISTFGITINRHFCGNRLISSSIFSSASSCCKGNCNKCHNETQSIRVTDAFEPAFSNEILKNPYSLLQLSYYNDLPFSDKSFINNQFISDISPDISPPEIMISARLLQIFRL
jgi:hypothetical protein